MVTKPDPNEINTRIRKLHVARPRVTEWNGYKPYAIAQVKHDGWRFTITRWAEDFITATVRDPKKDFWPKVAGTNWAKELAKFLPVGSILDGEIFVPGGSSWSVTSAIANNPELLVYSPFAIPLWDGFQTWNTNVELAHQIRQVADCANTFARLLHHPSVIETQTIDLSQCKGKVAIQNFAKALNVEGFVLKGGPYNDWYKIKRTRTVDCFVTGFRRGQGRFYDTVGSLEVSVWPVDENGNRVTEYRANRDSKAALSGDSPAKGAMRIANVSGMDETIRYAIRPKEDFMRVCEVEYQAVTVGGKLQHPRFKCWRDDKPVNECTAAQLL